MRSREIAGAAILAALASTLTLIGASTLIRMPPPFSYLVFDPSEIPPLIAYFMFGFKTSAIVATVHFIFLMFRGEFFPIGPLMKYVAIISTLVGFELFKRFKFKDLAVVIFSSIFRAVIMMFFNIFVLISLFRELVLAIGGNLIRGLTIILLVTAIYNVIHVIVFDYPIAKIVIMKLCKLNKNFSEQHS